MQIIQSLLTDDKHILFSILYDERDYKQYMRLISTQHTTYIKMLLISIAVLDLKM